MLVFMGEASFSKMGGEALCHIRSPTSGIRRVRPHGPPDRYNGTVYEPCFAKLRKMTRAPTSLQIGKALDERHD
jgi:hypothetical protein